MFSLIVTDKFKDFDDGMKLPKLASQAYPAC